MDILLEQHKLYQADTKEFVNHLLETAIRELASDIHVEALSNYSRIRFRIDGELFTVLQLTSNYHYPIVDRIKVLSNMDTVEKNTAQDGRMFLTTDDGTLIDFRVSSIPTINGEKVVLRILDPRKLKIIQKNIGFEAENIDKIHKLFQRENGIVLFSGPTGSGKTSTIFTVLNRIKSLKKNIVSIENPVEYKTDGINQININEKKGITFNETLKYLLRQDPDIIVVGEIRDKETAMTAINASTTGHLVIASIHTKNALATIDRLENLGVPRYAVKETLNAVISQRLVRQLCPHCKRERKPTLQEIKIFESQKIPLPDVVYSPNGCNCCHDGYLGRRAVYEVVEFDPSFNSQIYGLNYDNSFHPMSYNCLRLISEGSTTFEEYYHRFN